MTKQQIFATFQLFFKTTISSFFTNRLTLFLLTLNTMNFIINIKNKTDPYELIFTATLSIVNAIFESIQELKNKKNAAHINDLLQTKVKKVVDNSFVNTLSLNNNDLIFLQPGDKVVCDVVLVKYSNTNLPTSTKIVLVDESIFTGETYPVEKEVADNEYYCQDQDTYKIFYEQKNKKHIIEAGSYIVKGCAYGLVCDNGKTFNKIKKKYDKNTKIDSKMVQEIKKISNTLVKLISLHCFLLFFISLLTNIGIIDAVKICISLAITAIPEGLEIAVKICFSLACYRLIKKNVIIKDYRKIEKLANINIICTDKTGTITKNEQKIEKIFVVNNKKIRKIKQNMVEHYFSKPVFYSFFYHCTEVISVDGKFVGDPLDCAMYNHSLAYKQKNNVTLVDKKLFCHMKKYIKIKINIDNESYVLIKGAPQNILAKCKFDNIDEKKSIEKKIQKLCKNAYRVIACAYKIEKEEKNKYKFVCIVSFYDPPRLDVEKAITWCKENNIKVIVVTGDAKETTKSICNKINMLDDKKKKQVIKANKIKHIDSENIQNIKAIYRATPFDKCKLIEKIKTGENRLLMTGDGINDILAMQRSCVSFAMGTGADFCKQKSDAILLDDNFCNIINSIKISRGSLHNVFCILKYMMSSNLGELLCVTLCFISKQNSCLASRNLLFVNILTDSLPTYLIFFNKADTKKVQRRLDKAYYLRVIVVGVYIGCSTFFYYIFNILHYNNENISDAFVQDNNRLRHTTNCTIYLICCEFINSINNINLDKRIYLQAMYNQNKYLVLTALITPPIIFLCTHISFLSLFLGFAPIKMLDVVIISLLLIPVFLIDNLLK